MEYERTTHSILQPAVWQLELKRQLEWVKIFMKPNENHLFTYSMLHVYNGKSRDFYPSPFAGISGVCSEKKKKHTQEVFREHSLGWWLGVRTKFIHIKSHFTNGGV